MTRNQAELVEGLAPDEAAGVMALGTPVRVPSGTELFHLGTPAEFVYLVERGRIALTLPMRVLGRDENVFIEERTAGQALGWSALIPPHRFTLTATAPLDTDVIAIPRAALAAHLEAHPRVALKVMQTNQIRRLPVVDADERLVGMLSLADIAREAAHEHGQRTRPVSDDMVGGALEAVCRSRSAPGALVSAA